MDDKQHASLMTFFANNGDKQLVGIGLTDEMIDAIKKKGMVLEPESVTKQGIDIVIMYAPTLNELMAYAKTAIPYDKDDVRFA